MSMVARESVSIQEEQDNISGLSNDRQSDSKVKAALGMQLEEVTEAIEKELSVARGDGYTFGRTGMPRGSDLLFGSRDSEGSVPNSALRIPRRRNYSSKTLSKLDTLPEAPTSTLEIELALRKGEKAKVRDFESVPGSGWQFTGLLVGSLAPPPRSPHFPVGFGVVP